MGGKLKMKLDFNKKYNTIAIYSIIVSISSILFYMFMSKAEVFIANFKSFISILSPFIIGGALAYLVNFILVFFETRIEKIDFVKKYKKFNIRCVSIILSYTTIVIFLFFIIKFVVPQLLESLIGLKNNIPSYINSLSQFSSDILNNLSFDFKYFDPIAEKMVEFINSSLIILANSVPYLSNLIMSLASSIFNLFLGIIVSIYILNDKEKLSSIFKKILYSLFSLEFSKRILYILNLADNVFGKFLIGKFFDSIIIGFLTFIILTLIKLPYALLISVIIGITNIIPFFGPFFGAIPSSIIVLFTSPNEVLLFILIVFIIQQLDGNIIGPKILGESIGISAFWILFSLLIFSKLLGVLGMVIGVPIFAVLYTLIRQWTTSQLKKKNIEI